MKFSALIAIFLGVMIILSVTNFVSLSFGFVVEAFFAALFTYEGLKIFRRFKGEHLGSIIFAAILIIDLFNFWGIDWNFWELVVAMIGSYMVGWGVVSLFKKGFFRVVTNTNEVKSSRQNITLSRPLEVPEYDIEIEANLTKVLVLDTEDAEKAFDSSIFFDKSSFTGNLQYNKEGDTGLIKAKCKARSGVSSVLSKSRLNLEINSEPLVHLDAKLDGADSILDFSNLKMDIAKIKTNLSRISIVPSKVIDSRIEIDCEVTSLNIRIPKDVGIVISHDGELNWSNFNDLIEREMGYVSRNIDSAKFTCQLFVKSDMSKLSIEWI